MDSWWEFGEYTGFQGSELALYSIECPFCNEKGNWELTHREQKTKPNGSLFILIHINVVVAPLLF